MFFDLLSYLKAHNTWSQMAHGPGTRAEGLCKHIESEVQEIRKNPTDLGEWVDVIILAFDGALRAGYSPLEIGHGLSDKLKINEKRKWPRIGQDEPQHHIEGDLE